MIVKIRKVVFLFTLLFHFIPFSKAQLIINEVSQGPSGSKEYVELLVVGVPTCSSIPCLDLRGYYIDDNNGNFATGTGTGVAQGCVRFKNISFWSCIPIGTLILIYNDADINSSIPADDISMSDGNCKLVIPVSNCTLFEENTSFPSMTIATLPTSGFTACGSWAGLAMSNGDDSFQTVDPSGSSVFSVCWGNNTLNPTVYFSGTSAAMVAYMENTVDNDPNNQGNWTRATTVGNQTPGSANNAANASWISSMNNSCTALTPLVLSTSSTNAGCTCDGTATVAASGSNPPYSYSWAPSGGASATATGLCAGNYTVTVTSSNGCTETATETIVANPGLAITVNSATICSGQTATLTASGATNYVWSSGSTTNSETDSPSTTTSYTVTGSSGGCSGTAVATITVGNSPTINVNSETICSGQAATLTASGASSYVWSTGSTAISITETPSTTTSYTVTGSSGSCSGTAIATITVGSSMSISVNSETICSGQAATLTASGASTYVWSTGSTATSITDSPATTTTYTVTGSNGSCSGTATGIITVNPMPNIVFNASLVSGCVPFCVTFTDASTVSSGNIASWNWNFGDGGISDVQTPQHCFNIQGNYSVSLTVVSDSGCSATYTNTNMITLNPLPEAKFSIPLSLESLGTSVAFTDNSIGASSWNWDFGDMIDSANNSSSTVNPDHTYSEAGAYCVTLTVSNNAGCIDTSQQCLVIKPKFTFYIPNSFSPNGDGFNDDFYCKSEYCNQFEMIIYDRWGHVIFSSKDINEHWNGRVYKGSTIAKQDVYVYVVMVTDKNNELYQLTGNVTLVR